MRRWDGLLCAARGKSLVAAPDGDDDFLRRAKWDRHGNPRQSTLQRAARVAVISQNRDANSAAIRPS